VDFPKPTTAAELWTRRMGIAMIIIAAIGYLLSYTFNRSAGCFEYFLENPKFFIGREFDYDRDWDIIGRVMDHRDDDREFAKIAGLISTVVLIFGIVLIWGSGETERREKLREKWNLGKPGEKS